MADVSPDVLRKATDELQALVDDRLPLQFPEGDMWPPVAHGFLARGGTLLEAITIEVEQGMPGEAQMLLRILFEHVTVFCWLAIDPKAHVPQWREWSDSRQLQKHKRAKELFGITVLSDAEVAKAEKAKPPLRMPKLTEDVDAHWSEVSPAFRTYDPESPDLLTFLGLYTAVYSKASNLVHADPASVERFMTMPLAGQATIHAREKRSESNDYPSFALAMMGLLLVAFSHHFKWPTREVIDGLTAGLTPD
jgi:hypothetical protein